ncbi:MAG: primosomal protein N' [Alphaproteobacteria bacterium]|nr:primosomal protein N' [Alphaproteobacteria bacterium]
MQRISVLFPTPTGCYDYRAEADMPAGAFVRVPFGRRQAVGVVWDAPPDNTIPPEKIKPAAEILSVPPLGAQTIAFVNWVAGYTLSPVGMVLKMALIPDLEKTSKKPLTFGAPDPAHQTIRFSDKQAEAVRQLAGIDGFGVALLDGVTGSGKTEVYFEAIAQRLVDGGQVLVLLPEIALTTAWLDRFETRFGVKPAVWHSALTPKQRRDTWLAVAQGRTSVVVGARSALFLPFRDLKLIVVDEEHDTSFKQEEGVLYHARDMAIVRAKIAGCPIVLASATPSLETYCNAAAGKYRHITLPDRFADARMPDILIADMRCRDKGAVRFISPLLCQKLTEHLARGEQALLFLNRRGYAPLVLCRACGHRFQCPHCSAWLVEHKSGGRLQCHHCGHAIPKPAECPACHEADSLVSCGPGVERIHEEIAALFPAARAEIVTSEHIDNPAQFADLLGRMQTGLIDILIGTQMLAKGYHFANLTLVGVIDADMGLGGGDLRAGERTFQLLHQVMGRAGRAAKQGTAVLQSFNPDNMIIGALKNNDRTAFLAAETQARQMLEMPPFGRLAAIIVSGKNQAPAWEAARKIAGAAPKDADIAVLGPVAAPMALLRNKYRFRILVKTGRDCKLQKMLAGWLSRVRCPAGVDVRLDIDPYSFY